jgi:pantoate--beta-alanine ligase
MGALHDGHRALFAAARRESDTVVASIFVNPAQFDDPADLEAYRIDVEEDAQIAEACGVDLLFLPTVEEMYPEDFQTWVTVEAVSRGLEGEHRPGHFRGVATVCAKLFAIVRPDRAYFGEKDAQQAALIDRLVRDLALGLEIRVVPTVRDRDGLAASSRNARLSAEERRAAVAIPRALSAGKLAYRRGEDAVEAARRVLAEEPLLEPEYVEVAKFDGAAPVLAAAVRAGRTRLIDNVMLEGAHDE